MDAAGVGGRVFLRSKASYGVISRALGPSQFPASIRKPPISMFRFFEQLVDPYVAYPQQDTPPRKLWPFLLTYARPFRGAVCFGRA